MTLPLLTCELPPNLTGPPGLFNNTLVIYILGDNGASAEGFHGTIDELLTENSLPNTAKQQIEVRLLGATLGG